MEVRGNRGLHGFVYEPNPYLARVLRRGLERHGISITLAADVGEAMASLEKVAYHFALVEPCCRYGYLNGIVPYLRENHATLPRILISSWLPPDCRDEHFLYKPFTLRELLELLSKF